MGECVGGRTDHGLSGEEPSEWRVRKYERLRELTRIQC